MNKNKGSSQIPMWLSDAVKWIFKHLPTGMLFVTSWVFAIYLLALFHVTADLKQPQNIPIAHYLILFLGVVLPFLPFVK
jgi:hypothetical protein